MRKLGKLGYQLVTSAVRPRVRFRIQSPIWVDACALREVEQGVYGR